MPFIDSHPLTTLSFVKLSKYLQMTSLAPCTMLRTSGTMESMKEIPMTLGAPDHRLWSSCPRSAYTQDKALTWRPVNVSWMLEHVLLDLVFLRSDQMTPAPTQRVLRSKSSNSIRLSWGYLKQWMKSPPKDPSPPSNLHGSKSLSEVTDETSYNVLVICLKLRGSRW